MSFLWFFIFLVVGGFYYCSSFLQILLTIFCSIPLTKEISRIGALKDHQLNKKNRFVIIINFIIGIIICGFIFVFASKIMIYGFLFGILMCFLLSLKQLGGTKDNIDDFMNANVEHIDIEMVLKYTDE